MTAKQEKWVRRGIAAILAIALLFGIVANTSALSAENAVDSCDGASTNDSSSMTNCHPEKTNEPAPTFVAEEDDDIFRLKAGINLISFGNEINEATDTKGISVTFGNNIHTKNSVGYSFIAGNDIDVSGEINRDLFAVGNLISVSKEANIGGDVFAAGNEITIKADLKGDLALTASTVHLENINIDGNLDLSVEKVIFDGEVKIGGTLTYNDDATLIGLDNAEFDASNIYHIEKEETTLITIIYGKLLSAIALIIAMFVVILLTSNLHSHLEKTTRPSAIITDISLGAWFLLIIPIIGMLLICLVVGVPLALVLFALYIIAIYFSQGFAGAWVGHALIEKVFKSKSNIYVETIVGVVVLAALALLPYIGEITGILGALLGLGIMMSYIKPKLNPNLRSDSLTNRLIAQGAAKIKGNKDAKNNQSNRAGNNETNETKKSNKSDKSLKDQQISKDSKRIDSRDNHEDGDLDEEDKGGSSKSSENSQDSEDI